jgi:D-alanyl-D-alanine-carboxypeptidase/D-alanyl-D-alanine-endopeptidase
MRSSLLVRFGAVMLALVQLVSVGHAVRQPEAPSAAFPSNDAIRAMLGPRIASGDGMSGVNLGLVVGLIEPAGRRVVGVGRRAKDDTRPLDGDTVFEIGSVTKVFTALLLAEMVQRGEAALTDSIARFLPPDAKAPERNGRAITLADLATHTSGLPRMPSNFAPATPANPYSDYGAEQILQFLSGHTLTRDVGAQYEYSNFGAGLLGLLLARRANTSYEALLRDRVLGPLGLTSTSITLSPELRARLTPGHSAALVPVSAWDFPAQGGGLAGAGGLRSTANDMLAFLAANLGQMRTPLAPAIAALLAARRPTGQPVLDIGLGWHVVTQKDREIVWHNGGTGGYRSFVGYDAKARRGVVVLSNTMTSMGVDDIGVHLLNPSVPIAIPQPPRRQATVDPKLFDGYVGRYALRPDFILTVTRDESRLFVQATGQGRFELFAESDRSYFARVAEILITFETDDTGRAGSLVLSQGGQKVVGKRIE